MHWYKLSSEMTAGSDKYYSLTEYQQMIPFERDLYLEMILQRNAQAAAGTKVNQDDVVTDFEEFNG